MNVARHRTVLVQTVAHLVHRCLATLLVGGLVAFGAGCTRSSVDQALSSDANGFVCGKCSTKFYLPSNVFPGHCPQCKAPGIEMVVGYVCAADKHVTIGPRSKRGIACDQCGKVTAALSLPHEADLKAWGAAKKSNADVN